MVGGKEPAEEGSGDAYNEVEDGHAHRGEVLTAIVRRGDPGTIDGHKGIEHQ